MDNRPIGIFDSGVGGITVAREIISRTKENIVYFGDTKNMPYGEKTNAQLLAFSKKIIDYLISRNCKLIVIACNTVSSNCLDELKEHYDIDIVDVVSAAVEETIDKADKNICLFATKATVKSRVHEKKIKEIRPDLNVFNKACPLLVHLVEENFIHNEMPFLAVKEYCKEFSEKEIDTYILGCTHYPIILDSIKKAVGYDKKIIDPAAGTADHVERILKEKNIFGDNKIPKYEFYNSGDSENFEKIVKNLLDDKLGNIYMGEKIL